MANNTDAETVATLLEEIQQCTENIASFKRLSNTLGINSAEGNVVADAIKTLNTQIADKRRELAKILGISDTETENAEKLSAIIEYRRKAAQLEAICGKPVSPSEFYRDLFPVGSFENQNAMTGKSNAVIYFGETPNSSLEHRIVFDDLEGISTAAAGYNFVVTRPVGYFGRRALNSHMSLIFGIVIDLDGVKEQQLNNLLYQIQNKIQPVPTYFVSSGRGLHLYFNFERPVKAYRNTVAALNRLKEQLIIHIWNYYTSDYEQNGKQREIQGIAQAVRVVGSPSKLGRAFPVTAYRYGKPVSVEYLAGFTRLSAIQYTERSDGFTLAECKELFPAWYERRIVQGLPAGQWAVSRAVYDDWKRRVLSGASLHHRYFCTMALAIYARKCGIAREELTRDAEELRVYMDTLSDADRFTRDDVKTALTAYDKDKLVKMTARSIGKLCAIDVTRNNARTFHKDKEHRQKQAEHLEDARAVQASRQKRIGGTWRNMNGAPTKAAAVKAWKETHRDGTKAACERDTGLSRHTVLKWWNVQ